jgi:hypothetical protein
MFRFALSAVAAALLARTRRRRCSGSACCTCGRGPSRPGRASHRASACRQQSCTGDCRRG